MTRDPASAAGAEVAAREVALRPAAPADELFLREVYASSRADELAAVAWPAEQREAFLEMQFRAQQSDYARRFPGAEHSVVLVGERPAGRVWVHESEDELRLLDITLLPEQQGRGLGSIVLRRLQERARRAGVPLRHTVLTANAGAIRLYQRLGFAVVDSTPTHHLMRWEPGTGERA